MALHNTYRPVRELVASNGAGQKGFTLLETLVVMGIFTLLMGIVGVISFNSYSGYLFRSERSTVISVLERARSRAMANYYGETHGVCYVAPNYIMFRGSDCSDNPELIGGNPNAQITGLDIVTFDKLTGELIQSVSGPAEGCVDNEKSIKVQDGGKESYVCINKEGRVNW